MESIARTLAMGGSFMYLIVLCIMPLLTFGLLHVILARKWTLIVTLSLWVLPLLLGAAGYLRGASMVEQALIAADPAHRDEMATVGYAEAKLPLYFGLGLSGVGLVPLAAGELRRRRKA